MWTILSLMVFAILVEANAPNGTQNELTGSNASARQDSASSAAPSLLDKYNQFQKTYAQTLMNSTFLPFVDGCRAVMVETKPVTPLKSKDRFLCLTYFDMLSNLIVNADKEYTLVDKVNASLRDYDNATLVNNFCEFFGGELPTENANRPFVMKMLDNQSVWMNAAQTPDKCKRLCYELDEQSLLRISSICKLVSGGYRLIKRLSVNGKSAIKTGTLPPQAQSKSSQNAPAKVAGEQIKPVPPMSKESKVQPNTNTSQSSTTLKNQMHVAASSANTNSSSVKASEEATKKKTSPMANGVLEAAAKASTAHASSEGKVNSHNDEPVVDTHREEDEEEDVDTFGKIRTHQINYIYFFTSEVSFSIENTCTNFFT